MRPRLAESWSTSSDGLSVTVRIHPRAKFQDGTPVTGDLVAQALRRALPPLMGPVFDDVAEIAAPDSSTVRINLRRPSQFILESLETAIQEPGKAGIGTGAFIAGKTAGSPTVLTANANYYREPPAIKQISVTSYPTARAAWADLLRGNLDMLYEVNIDALDSLERASNIAVFSFVRRYQYMIVFGPHATALQSPAVRRALSAALDRDAIVRDALNGHGVASRGPVSTEHWAFPANDHREVAQQNLAKTLAPMHVKFTCLVPPDAVYQRIALAVRQQLAAVSVDMEVVEASQEDVVAAGQSGNFEALLGDIVSGPTFLRQYRHWYSRTTAIPQPLGSPRIDAPLDQIRHAKSDDEYRAGVAAFLHAMDDEPPALFIAWSQAARAVSRRFEVPAPEFGRDVLNSIGLWRPAPQAASTN